MGTSVQQNAPHLLRRLPVSEPSPTRRSHHRARPRASLRRVLRRVLRGPRLEPAPPAAVPELRAGRVESDARAADASRREIFALGGYLVQELRSRGGRASAMRRAAAFPRVVENKTKRIKMRARWLRSTSRLRRRSQEVVGVGVGAHLEERPVVRPDVVVHELVEHHENDVPEVVPPRIARGVPELYPHALAAVVVVPDAVALLGFHLQERRDAPSTRAHDGLDVPRAPLEETARGRVVRAPEGRDLVHAVRLRGGGGGGRGRPRGRPRGASGRGHPARGRGAARSEDEVETRSSRLSLDVIRLVIRPICRSRASDARVITARSIEALTARTARVDRSARETSTENFTGRSRAHRACEP